MMRITIILALLFVSTSAAHAAPVYTWTDDQGVTHYASKPTHQSAKPAELPEITRGEVKLSKVDLVSCDKHGGIDCQSGADTDGSVLCYDGFRGASARFLFTCKTAKLELADVSEVQDNGAFKAFIRNKKPVAANKVSVIYETIEGAKLALTGPADIEPFGMAEYAFAPQVGRSVEIPSKPTIAELTMSCANCP